MPTTTSLIVAALSDVASAVGIPGGATVSELVNAHLQRKQAAAINLLLEELRQGEISVTGAAAQSEFISCLWRFSRAAIEGAAHENLRMLARTFAGLAESQPTYADEFKRYADALSDLTGEEIRVLGTLHKICVKLRLQQGVYEPYAETALRNTEQMLVTNEFSKLMLYGTLAALQRTGLVTRGVTMDDMGGWITTPMMDKVAKLAQFDESLGCTIVRRGHSVAV